MNQQCKVCGEPAAGFHFGAFTCEGCKSFFGRTYNNLSSISECKNNNECVIDKKNRTSCKACRLRKCLMVGMSKSGSRYGRRSNWFKIHCLMQEQQQQQQHQQQHQHQQHHGPQNGETTALFGTPPPATLFSPFFGGLSSLVGPSPPPPHPPPHPPHHNHLHNNQHRLQHQHEPLYKRCKLEPRSSDDSSGGSSVDDDGCSVGPSPRPPPRLYGGPLSTPPPSRFLYPSLAAQTPAGASGMLVLGGDLLLCSPALGGVAVEQEQPIDLSVRACHRSGSTPPKSPPREDVQRRDGRATPLDLTNKRPHEVHLSG